MTNKLCLNMIVKNEIKILQRAFNSIVKYIDYYCICDTGSTDGTQEFIKSFFLAHNIPGKVVQHNWINFGENRTMALNEAYKYNEELGADKCFQYIFLMDADMELVVDDPDFKNKLSAEQIHLKQGGGSCLYYNTRILKVDPVRKFYYVGVTHEYIGHSFENCIESNFDLIHFADHCDGANRPEKYTRDIALLEKGLVDDPNNGRYMFYLAQSYQETRQFEKAAYWYSKRTQTSGWFEEIYMAYFRIGKCFQDMNKRYTEIIDAYMAAHHYLVNHGFKPRVEPVYEIIFMLRCMKKFSMAYDNYASLALSIKFPTDYLLFLNKDNYDYQVKDEVALCAFYSKHYEHAAQLWEQILQSGIYYSHLKERFENNLEFARNNISKKSLTKQILCFYVGYTHDMNDDSYKDKKEGGIYGSELALVKLSEEFSKFYDVYVWGPMQKNCIRNGVNYRHCSGLNDFLTKYEVEIMIISRYVHYIVEFGLVAKKTYVWMHDMCCQPWWNGTSFPRESKYLLENSMDKITGLIALSPWHKEYILGLYDIDPNKIFIVGNGIDPTNWNTSTPITKVPNRFIYTSAPNRGLPKLLEYFHKLRKDLPDAELFVYRGMEDFVSRPELLDEMNKYDYFHYMGKIDNDLLIKEFIKSEFWFYPTNWLETYCISALEAQLSECVCICSNIGALDSTVGSRGVLLKNNLYSNEYENEAIQAVLSLASDRKKMKEMTTSAKQWALGQTWSARCHEWMNLFGYKWGKQNSFSQTCDMPTLDNPKLKVKLLCNFDTSQNLLTMYKKLLPSDSNLTLVSSEKADYYMIINHPRSDEYYDPSKTILIKMEEKESSRPYFPKEFVDVDHTRFMLVYDKRNSWEWHLSKTYAELVDEPVVKTKLISAVISSEYRLDGHIKRIELLHYLDKMNFDYDHYGRSNKHDLQHYKGSLPYHQKDDGILPYKYTIGIENTSINGYVTEKLVDGILGECVVFYWGCPNVSEFVDPACYVYLDLDDFEKSYNLIKTSIENNIWEKRIDKIRQEKKRIIQNESVLSKLGQLITQSRSDPDWQGDQMPEYWEWKEWRNYFHGDTHMMSLVKQVMSCSDVFIETGAYRGASSGFVAESFPNKPVYSCDTNSKWFSIVKQTTRNIPNYNIENEQSLPFLLKLSYKYKNSSTFFFLDAHTNNQSPLLDELMFIFSSYSRYFILVDDFCVPNNSKYNYNKVGGFSYTLDNIIHLLPNDVNIYFPNYSDKTSIYHPLVGYVLITNQDITLSKEFTRYHRDSTKYTTCIVNLDRRDDRWEQMESKLDDVKLSDIQRFSAVDGNNLVLTPELEELFHVDGPTETYMGKRVNKHHNYNAPVLGCCLSHYNLWKKLVNDTSMCNEDGYLILEDDIRFISGFNERWSKIYSTLQFDNRWDILYLGWNDDSAGLYEKYGDSVVWDGVRMFNQHPSVTRVHGGGTFGYYIKKKAAIKMLDLVALHKIKQPIDHFMIDQFDVLTVYKTDPSLVVSDVYGQNNLDSDIQGKLLKLK